jgi:hypothetical protein
MRLALDLIFLRGAEAAGSGGCPQKICDPLSDHMPVRARIRF